MLALLLWVRDTPMLGNLATDAPNIDQADQEAPPPAEGSDGQGAPSGEVPLTIQCTRGLGRSRPEPGLYPR
jgi:hypothetical protein